MPILAAAVLGGLVVVMLDSGIWLYIQAVFHDPVSSRMRAAMHLAFATTCVAAPSVGFYLLYFYARAWRALGTGLARARLLALLVAALVLGAAAMTGVLWTLYSLNDAGVI
ncbi:hypothetical protein [Actinomyces sp. 2119]|uniref:hypothetical protein n=1 Tax=Actinomyces sp. 2119 TaxID=2321393 RepID=UPI0011C41BCE|nr:hypothetical protein [Actinomyces sp. 2119]